jgi:VWFA-related protein
MTMKHPLIGVAPVLVAGVTLIAQQPLTPTFRVQVDAIELDAFVTDAQGNPVTGLTVNDFQILEDGKPQVITSFSQVDIPFERRSQPLDAMSVAQPDVQANDYSDGRLYMFVLDDVSPAVALRAKVFLNRFLDRHFAANDRGAVVLLGRQNSTAGQTFTNDPRLLLAAVERYTGGFSAENAPSTPAADDPVAGGSNALIERFKAAKGAEAAIAALDTMAGLESAVNAIARLHGRRKALLLFSTGMPEPIFRALSYDGGAMTRAEQAAHAAVTAATRGSVTIYAIDPAGLMAGTIDAGAENFQERDVLSDDPAVNGLGPSNNRMSLSMLADATGGFSLVNSNGFTAAFDRIVRENSTYYLLGFTSSNERRDGRHRNLRVRVTRPGLQVRAREGYVAPLKNERAPEPVRIASLSPTVSSALLNPLSDGAVPIRLAAAPYRREGKNALVAIAAEIDPSALGLTESGGVFRGELEIGFLATDNRARTYQGEHYTVDLALNAETYNIARQQRSLRVLSEIQLPPGRYQLRFAAGNPAGLAGNVVYELGVPDFRGDAMMLSGLAVTSASTTRAATVAAKSPLKAFLPRPPIARREFDAGDTLGIFGEVYNNVPAEDFSTIDVLAELRAKDGRVVRLESAHTERFLIELPLTGLAPGPYVIHFDARTTSGKLRTASRDIPIRIR